MTKNLQSIREQSRFEDFLSELAETEYDIGFFSETWRKEREEIITMPRGGTLYLSGGALHHGVGLSISRNFASKLTDVIFQSFSTRLCTLDFAYKGKCFRAFSCYFPTSWDSEESVEEVYDTLSLLLDDCRRHGVTPLLGGDFNACVGLPQPTDDVEALGRCGTGRRNIRGLLLIKFALLHGLQILNRQAEETKCAESWTCKRALDGAFVQIDFVLSDLSVQCQETWCNNSVGVGLDHRCVHCLARVRVNKAVKRAGVKRKSFKNWQPVLNQDGEALRFKQYLQKKLAETDANRPPDFLEDILIEAATKFGSAVRETRSFKPSASLSALRRQRRNTREQSELKELSFQIRRQHRQEVRAWKGAQIRRLLDEPSRWKQLRQIHSKISGRVQPQAPVADEFAQMLGDLFRGSAETPARPDVMSEVPFSMDELDKAIAKMKANRSPDERGLVAELLKHSPAEFRQALLNLYNEVLVLGSPPDTWRRTLFLMIPKSARAKMVTDYRPIASLRLLYKGFAYLVLARIEEKLEAAQPEEQHAFRSDRRLEEHLMTADMFIEKTRAQNIPIWIVSLDLSKAFDRVAWPTLWKALLEHGVSEHMVWILQSLYHAQTGQVQGKSKNSCLFEILAGVRQGCVLSPRLFCSALELAMAGWRQKVESFGFDLGDGMRWLLDLRFADDVVFFARSEAEAAHALDVLVAELAKVGLLLNVSKTVVLTTQAQPPDALKTHDGKIIQRVTFHKWLGCILELDARQQTLEYHLQAAARAFYANGWILKDQQVSYIQRLRYFEKVISPVACFAAGRRKVYQEDLHKVNVLFRKLARQIIGPPAGIDWTTPWHEILHEWHLKLSKVIVDTNTCSWGRSCLRQHWKLASYIARLPPDRWVKRILHWLPVGRRSRGRPRDNWDAQIVDFCTQANIGDWMIAAQDEQGWTALVDDFVDFALNKGR